MQDQALAQSTLRIRRDIIPPKCAIEGCNEPPTKRLPENMQVREFIWCKPHANLIAHEIAMRNYRDFVEGMRQQGIKGEPIAQPPRTAEDRRCAVPRCKREIVTWTDLFSPYKSPGQVSGCALHSGILQEVVRKQNGRRVIHELWTPRRQKPDTENRSRKKAILSAYANCHGKPRYIECVCKTLQKARVHMPARWLERWGTKSGLQFEPYDWFTAYQEKRIRATIEKYISRVCKPKLRMSPE
jgi:hypothetical protein